MNIFVVLFSTHSFKKEKETIMKSTILFLCLLYASQPYANLINRGNGLIYDSSQNLTWVQDPLAAIEAARDHPGDIGKTATITLAPNGRSNFGDPAVLYNLRGINYLGYSDWRRPTTVSTITGTTTIEAVLAELTGTNVDGELANLFRDNDTSIFNNITGQVFWAASQQLADPAHGVFSNNGVLMYLVDSNEQVLVNRQIVLASEWAVRSGDVATISTPIPPSIFLFISGLLPFYMKNCRI